MPFEKGKSGNLNGRPLGKKNEITNDIRQSFSKLLENKLPELESWLTKVAEKNPDKAIELLVKISDRLVPKITKNEVTGADGKDLFEGLKFKFNTPKKEDDDE